jgi:tRNA (mo5U34)-methyltransferase
MRHRVKHFLEKIRPTEAQGQQVPASGFAENNVDSGPVEFYSDDELQRLNAILPWMCFTADSKGRRFGDMAWSGKRDTPQKIPDARIVHLDALFDLSDKSVLEVGCFEGVHTIALAQHAAKVYAVDSRVENVVKTLVRANLFGHQPTVTLCDLEQDDQVNRLLKVDVLHHVGVLYHLKDPVKHLFQLQAIAGRGILLDTHYATAEMADRTLEFKGVHYRYKHYQESGVNEVFSGMYDHAKWLLLEDIRSVLSAIGFSDVRVVKDEVQRNGPRVTLYAGKPSAMAEVTSGPF